LLDRFTTRAKEIGPIPLYGDHDKAQDLYSAYQKLVSKYKRQKIKILNQSPKEDELVWWNLWDSLVVQSAWKSTSRVLAALPSPMTQEVHDELQQVGGIKPYKVRDYIRSPEWLQEHGVCADHLRIQESTLPQAGHGAFANRFLSKDSVILPVPVIHIPDRSVLNMYRIIYRKEKINNHDHKSNGRKKSKVIRDIDKSVITGHQLLLNYCLGHEESTLLLSPYGPIFNTINHNQTMANVQLQWADPKRSSHKPTLLQRDVASLSDINYAGLALELVALRDIQPHEEIFLDYGTAWELAWQRHLADWKPVPGADTYVSAELLNRNQTSNTKRLLTEFEQMKHPYPENVALRFNDVDEEGSEWLDCEILNAQVNPRSGQIVYTVVVPKNDDDDDKATTTTKTNTSKNVKFRVMKNVRRENIAFVDRPYTSDMLLPNAFRHDIRIPNDLFPEAWKNRKMNTSIS
jgi:hypothetical protein